MKTVQKRNLGSIVIVLFFQIWFCLIPLRLLNESMYLPVIYPHLFHSLFCFWLEWFITDDGPPFQCLITYVAETHNFPDFFHFYSFFSESIFLFSFIVVAVYQESSQFWMGVSPSIKPCDAHQSLACWLLLAKFLDQLCVQGVILEPFPNTTHKEQLPNRSQTILVQGLM